jgi:ABC-type cobalamin transport system permease subunit
MRGYKIVQTIYRGWALLDILQAGAVLFTMILIFYVRRRAGMFFMTLATFLCLASTLVTFYIHLSPKHCHQQLEHITYKLDAAQATMGVFTFHRISGIFPVLQSAVADHRRKKASRLPL